VKILATSTHISIDIPVWF